MKKKKMFPCNVCESKFAVKGTLKSHLIRAHWNEKSFSCQKCNKNFTYLGAFKNHMDKCNIESKNDESQNIKSENVKHEKLQEPSKKAIISSENELDDIHKSESTIETKIGTTSILQPNSSENLDISVELPFNCKFCPEKFKDVQQIITHIKIHDHNKDPIKQ